MPKHQHIYIMVYICVSMHIFWHTWWLIFVLLTWALLTLSAGSVATCTCVVVYFLGCELHNIAESHTPRKSVWNNWLDGPTTGIFGCASPLSILYMYRKYQESHTLLFVYKHSRQQEAWMSRTVKLIWIWMVLRCMLPLCYMYMQLWRLMSSNCINDCIYQTLPNNYIA